MIVAIVPSLRSETAKSARSGARVLREAAAIFDNLVVIEDGWPPAGLLVG